MFDCITHARCAVCTEDRCCALIRIDGRLKGMYCQDCIFTLAPFVDFSYARRQAVRLTYALGIAKFPACRHAEQQHHVRNGTAMLARVLGDEAVAYG